MLIKAQDGTVYNLVCITRLFVDNTSSYSYEIVAGVGKRLFTLGEYQTESDANKVLENMIKSCSQIMSFIGGGENQIYEEIYEMPKKFDVSIDDD